jgi:uncharacterized protein
MIGRVFCMFLFLMRETIPQSHANGGSMKKTSFLIILVIFSLFPHHGFSQEVKKAAIIIDDFGGGVGGVNDFLEGDVQITAAIMPFTELSKKHAEWAYKNGLEIMVHLPMQPKRGKASWLGPRPITNNLSKEEVRRRVIAAIESVPHAVGINNHMGSLVVENEDIVRVIVEVAKEKQLYIVDSATSPKSKFQDIAEELDVPFIKRDVFLDDICSVNQVKKQMLILARIAESRGTAVAIGHVGTSGKVCSLGVTESMPKFKEKHIKVVPVSELLSDSIRSKYVHLY